MRKIDRPIGVYISTILIVIGYGLFPLLVAFNNIRESESRLPFTIVFISFLLPSFSIAAAIWAFAGDNEARVATLAIVSLNFLWWTFLAITSVAYSENEGFDAALLLLRMIRPV